MKTFKPLAGLAVLVLCMAGAGAKELAVKKTPPGGGTKIVVNIPPEVQANCTKGVDSNTTQCYQNFCKGQSAGNFNGNLTQPLCDTNASDPTKK